MSQELALLDEALELAKLEKTALEGGSYDEAIELAEKRSKLTGMAWNMMDMANEAPYKRRIMELSSIQEQLTGMATRAQDAIRQRLNRSRQEKKRMHGYHMAVGQALQ